MDKQQLAADTSFFKVLLKHIMKGVNVPKVQIERVIGPILGLFIEDVMSSLLKEKVVTLSAEFPIRKLAQEFQEQNNQSTNIDWLMYAEESKTLVFVELKTTDTAFRAGQAALYTALQSKIAEKSAQFLSEDIVAITKASKESGKYKNISKRMAKTGANFADIRRSKIVYLLPEAAKTRTSESEKAGMEFYSFGELRIKRSLKNPFLAHWKVLHKSLQRLDKITRVSRNEPAEHGVSFENIRKACEDSKGKACFVGFAGGINRLKSCSLSYLKERAYKLDKHMDGIKLAKNWIPANDFLAAVAEIESREV